MKLEELFLGKEEKIVYRGQEIFARRLRGADGVYQGKFQGVGGIFLRRWKQEDESGETPGERAKKTWRKDEMDFSFFPAGLVSARRGRCFASFKAAQKVVPRLEQILDFFETEVREKIVTQKFFFWEPLPEKFRERLFRAGYLFSKATNPGLSESFCQISCLIAGANGKINVGAFLARTVAITDRLRERLAGIYGWLAVYSAQEQAMAVIEWRFQEVFKKLQHEMKLWRRHGALSGHTSKQQKILLEQKVLQAIKSLESFSLIKPFERWVSFTIDDIEQLARLVKSSSWPEALAVLNRLELSFDIKSCQRNLDSLLRRLGEDEILGRWDSKVYLEAIRRLVHYFNKLDQTEELLNFREPVARKAKEFLLEADFLVKFGNFEKLKKPLRQAYDLF